jgi:hypothetical protein
MVAVDILWIFDLLSGYRKAEAGLRGDRECGVENEEELEGQKKIVGDKRPQLGKFAPEHFFSRRGMRGSHSTMSHLDNLRA